MMKLRIGIDLAPLVAHGSGIPVFARQVLGGIAAARPDWAICGFGWSGWSDARPLLASAEEPDARQGSSWRPPEKARARLSALGLSLPLVSAARLRARRARFALARQPQLDLFHAVNFLPPGRMGCAVVPVVHDLFHLREPAMVHPARRTALAGLGEIVRAAPRVQCVSNHTAGDVVAAYGVPRERIDIVHPAVRDVFFRPADLNAVSSLGLTPRRYWLAVGMGERRKNLKLLLDVFEREGGLCSPVFPLVLTGAPAWQGGDDGRLRRMREAGSLREMGFVPLDTLAALYAGTAGFLMPSLYEGFGLPLAEALAAGAPCLAADNSSLPEVSGGHALHVGITDPDGWAKAMRRMRDRPRDPAATVAGQQFVARFSQAATVNAAIASLEAAHASR